MSKHLHHKPQSTNTQLLLRKQEQQRLEKQARSASGPTPDTIQTQPVFVSKVQEELWNAQQVRQKKEKDKRREELKAHKTQESIRKLVDVEDQVTLNSFVWQKDEKGEYDLQSPPQSPYTTSVDLSTNSKELLRHMGQKIDFQSKLPSLKHEYIQAVIQSRSHNFFLSKYAQFKVGVIGKLLSSLNVNPDELKQLQNKAINQAMTDNVQAMADNIYNMEIADLFQGRNKKSRSAMKMFKEIERQLMAQMFKLGKQDFWNKIRVLEERVAQLKKIEDELSAERKALGYHLDMMTQIQVSGV
jgi:hypothetical protein